MARRRLAAFTTESGGASTAGAAGAACGTSLRTRLWLVSAKYTFREPSRTKPRGPFSGVAGSPPAMVWITPSGVTWRMRLFPVKRSGLPSKSGVFACSAMFPITR